MSLFYVASAYEELVRTQLVIDTLQHHGHRCILDWTRLSPELELREVEIAECELAAVEQLGGIGTLIALTPQSPGIGRFMWAEMAVAARSAVTTILVDGPKEHQCLAASLATYVVASDADAIAHVRRRAA